MPQFIVTYDIQSTMPAPHWEFARQGQVHGWSTRIPLSDGSFGRLPNTTLWGEFVNMDAAARAFAATRETTMQVLNGQVNVERYTIMHAASTSGVYDDVQFPQAIPEPRGLFGIRS